MDRWHALLPNWAIFTLLALIVVFNLISYHFQNEIFSNIISLALIPVLFGIYFFKQRIMANVFLTAFLLYFLGIVFTLDDTHILSAKFSESCFLGAYALLIFVMIGRLKHVKFEGLISWYLIVVVFINAYLMYTMFANVQGNLIDSVLLTLGIAKGVVLLVMAFLAFAIYLSKESTQSIIFLSMVCCFVFVDVLSFTTDLYIQYWLFEVFAKTLQGIGLLLLCVYVYNHQSYMNQCHIKEDPRPIEKSNQLTA
ncbi:hypothetical protein ES711_09445 [Gelidibacter salicanalis]|uniref:Lysoplasmalogenase n=1 Tax=Gelidibacter salicanalis TaxID=291193 RepID=A0A5C7AJG0_9FLAO|nr:hypothetical protein [Gelidibacter salicanalis]TXE07663.1 hypothetical protein ES711_09445 [Gelidibacter salicanalis]